MHEVLVNRLGGLSLPRKCVVSLTDRPDMTLDVYCGRKTTMQQQLNTPVCIFIVALVIDLWCHLTYNLKKAWYTMYAMLLLNYK